MISLASSGVFLSTQRKRPQVSGCESCNVLLSILHYKDIFQWQTSQFLTLLNVEIVEGKKSTWVVSSQVSTSGQWWRPSQQWAFHKFNLLALSGFFSPCSSVWVFLNHDSDDSTLSLIGFLSCRYCFGGVLQNFPHTSCLFFWISLKRSQTAWKALWHLWKPPFTIVDVFSSNVAFKASACHPWHLVWSHFFRNSSWSHFSCPPLLFPKK